MTPTNEIDEFTRLDRELTGLHNGMYDLDDEIKTACQNDKTVKEKIEDVYEAIYDLQKAIAKYKKKTTQQT